MRTSMAYPMRFWAIVLACLLVYQFSTETWGDNQDKTHQTVAEVSTADKNECKAIKAPKDPMRLVGANSKSLNPHGG